MLWILDSSRVRLKWFRVGWCTFNTIFHVRNFVFISQGTKMYCCTLSNLRKKQLRNRKYRDFFKVFGAHKLSYPPNKFPKQCGSNINYTIRVKQLFSIHLISKIHCFGDILRL